MTAPTKADLLRRAWAETRAANQGAEQEPEPEQEDEEERLSPQQVEARRGLVRRLVLQIFPQLEGQLKEEEEEEEESKPNPPPEPDKP